MRVVAGANSPRRRGHGREADRVYRAQILGFVQPAIKVRGPEYLRIIYGPEYDLEDNLSGLRRRGVGLKRSLALQEFALAQETLTRFVGRQPLRQVHECVFAILAMECEPLASRL